MCYRSPNNIFQSEMPEFAEWRELSGGKNNRKDSLIKYIDKRVKDHSIYYAKLCRTNDPEYMWIVLGCLTELLYATRMYTTAYRGERRPHEMGEGHSGLSKNTFGLGRIGQDGSQRVLAPRSGGDSGWNRYDAVDALEAMTERELCSLLGTRDRTDLDRKIARAEVCKIQPQKAKQDTGGGRWGKAPLATYLNVIQRSEYRVLFDCGIAKMRHTSDNIGTPFDWIPAETPDKTNSCTKDLYQLLVDSKDENKLIVFKRGGEEYEKWYRSHSGFVTVSGYALAPQHKLFMSIKHRASSTGTAGFFHSAYTSGEGVVCSGSLKLEKGIPLLVTNMSGHYTPEARKLDYMIRLFEITGVPTNRMSIIAMSGPGEYWYYKPGELNQFRMDLRRM